VERLVMKRTVAESDDIPKKSVISILRQAAGAKISLID
jgi:hypothetical protein